MKKLKKAWLLAVIALGTLLLTNKSLAAELTDVYLTIIGWSVTIGSTASIDLGTVTVSAASQDVEWTFVDHFWVEDLKGADAGYYTTVQVGDMTSTNWTIPAANIAMRVNPATIALLWWASNSLVELASTWSTYAAIDSPLTFVERSTGGSQAAGPNNGVLGKYGVLPWVKVTIPAYQAIGAYTATITYTLIEN